MEKNKSRRLLLVLVALLGVIGLVVVSAVASVFAYRALSGEGRTRVSVDFDDLRFDQDQQVAAGDQDQGVIILRVEPGSPAEQVGLSSGTVILSVNGRAVNSPQELKDVIGEYEVGDTITLTIQDGETSRDVAVTLADAGPYLGVNVGTPGGRHFHFDEYHGQMPHGFLVPRFPEQRGGPEGPEGTMPHDFPFDEFDIEPFEDHGRFFDLLGNSALVTTVVEDSPAANAGLQAGDAIVEANGQAIEDSQQLIDLISGLAPGDELTLQVQRGSETLTIDLALANHPDDEARAYLGVFLAPARFHSEMELFQEQENG